MGESRDVRQPCCPAWISTHSFTSVSEISWKFDKDKKIVVVTTEYEVGTGKLE